MEVVDSILFSQLNMNFETRLEKIIKQLDCFRFPIERGHRCRQWLGNGNSVKIVMEICEIVVVCQLLKRQYYLVCLNRCRGVFTAELRLTCRKVLFLLSWRYIRGAVSDFFMGSCHVVAIANLFSSSCHDDVAAEALSLWTPVTMSWLSSGPKFCVIWLLERPASGWGLLWESSSFVPWLILHTFRDVSGAVPEWPWVSGFMKKSSSRASAPSMRFSVLLNSCDNFLVTLPSISSETWVM